jgi:hypothetical protein
MYNSDTELLFPPRAIPTLVDLRGESWNELVSKVMKLETTERDSIAFVLLMVRLSGCTGCTADSFRAMRGCSQCARQTIRRFRGSDEDLRASFNQASQEIDLYLESTASS